MLAGDVAKDRLRLDQLPSVLALYAIGLLGVFAALSLMYRHALGQRHELELTELEQFDTSTMLKRWSFATIFASSILLWCLALIAMPGHIHARDRVFDLTFRGGSVALLLLAFSQALLRRRLKRDRDSLIARIGAEDPPPAVTLLD